MSDLDYVAQQLQQTQPVPVQQQPKSMIDYWKEKQALIRMTGESILSSLDDDGLVISDSEEEFGDQGLMEPQDEPAVYQTKNEQQPEVKAPSIQVIPFEQQIQPMGQVYAVLDDTVVIQSFPLDNVTHNLALDEGTILAYADRSVLGEVFETFGSIERPFYSVRFNLASDIDAQKCFVGTLIFTSQVYSKPIFDLDSLKVKGTDASNLYDEEAEVPDFSDDEQEQQYKRQNKKRHQHEVVDSSRTTSQSSQLNHPSPPPSLYVDQAPSEPNVCPQQTMNQREQQYQYMQQYMPQYQYPQYPVQQHQQPVVHAQVDPKQRQHLIYAPQQEEANSNMILQMARLQQLMQQKK